MIARLALAALVLGGSVAICCGGEGRDSTDASAATTQGAAAVLVYRLEPGAKQVTAATQSRAISILERRLRGVGIAGGVVRRRGDRGISVELPNGADATRAASEAVVAGQLAMYDWESSLIGRERTIGAHPGRQPPAAALKEAQSEWKAAGRTGQEVEGLIYAGAFPTAYGAVRLASERAPVKDCAKCPTGTPTFYLFSDDGEHELISGPVSSKRDLYVGSSGGRLARRGEVVRVPVGTVVVHELPEREGVPITGAKPGWYALAGEPALTGSEITHPEVRTQEGGLAVVFEFTDSGRVAFRDVTRRIARRGMKEAIGVPSQEEVEALSGHFAVVLDGEVKTRPIINFRENPNGIDGRTGAQISGGFSSIGEAKEFATALRYGALPVRLVPVIQKPER